jgi:hypothetical protein
MISIVDWQSAGPLACMALIAYGIVFLALVLPRFRKRGPISKIIPAALAWHFIVWFIFAFYIMPHYAVTTGIDFHTYHNDAIGAADSIRAGEWGNLSWGLGTSFIPIITALFYLPFGGDVYGMLFLSAVLGFCGALFFCRAFGLWATKAELRRYSVIVLFLPSFATWTSTFGKDSWMALGLGLAAYGFSSLLKFSKLNALPSLFCGIAIITVVRPHVAMVMVASMASTYFFNLGQKSQVSVGAELLRFILLLALCTIITLIARQFLHISSMSISSLEGYAREKGGTNAIGGSAVEITAAPGIGGAISGFPSAIVRILFRPFPWEVNSILAGLAAVENLILLCFVIVYWRRFLAITHNPYILFSGFFASALLLMFSFVPNLGLLSRQRCQLLPFLFVVLVGLSKRAANLPMPLYLNRVKQGQVVYAPHPILNSIRQRPSQLL